MKIRPACRDEAEEISELALRSKAVWGYPPEMVERFRAELTYRPSELAALRAHVADEDGAIVGFFTVRGSPPEGELDSLYVRADARGRGLGRALLAGALDLARGEGFRALLVHADPNAEPFYLRHGAVRVGEVPSGSIPGRFLPLLRVAIYGGAASGMRTT